MKKYWYLIFMLPVMVFGQDNNKNYDYFVQFNTPSFVKKVSIDSVFQHKLFKTGSENNSKLKMQEFISFMDKSKPMVIHGNVSDSLSYYQMTIPLIDDQKVQQLIQNRIAENQKDSIVETIKSFPKYQLYSPTSETFSIAWNKNYLIVYGLLDENKSNIYTAETTATPVTDEIVVEEIKEEKPTDDAVVVESAPIEESASEDEMEEEYDDAYYEKQDQEYRKERERIKLEKTKKQEKQIAVLFENGFVMPTSNKVNATSDIASWVNYQSLSSKMTAFYYQFSSLFPNKKLESSNNVVKGMNMDINFDNDKTKVEQTVEYSESLAKIMSKIVSRKPNKDIYKFFPKEKPVGYMSYHFSAEEALKYYPEVTEQFLMNLPFERQDAQIITDLLSTIIDEKATATLFDGDMSMFWHATETYKHTYKNKVFNEDYEEVEEDKTITKTRPIFSFVMTSTHATMANRLLDLGVRKKALVKENNVYRVKEKSDEFGDIVFLKEGDVFIVSNGLNYLTNGSNSEFVKEFKKNTRKNYIVGNLDIQKMSKDIAKSLDQEKDIAFLNKMGNQFKNIQFKSAKKIKDNKATFEMEMNTTPSNKNIVLQMLDLLANLK